MIYLKFESLLHIIIEYTGFKPLNFGICSCLELLSENFFPSTRIASTLISCVSEMMLVDWLAFYSLHFKDSNLVL